jgi:hypothetical protein
MGDGGVAGTGFGDPGELHQFVGREESSGLHHCTICTKTAATRRDVRNHVESIHFPDSFVYDCEYCDKKMKTKKQRDWHMGKEHKGLNIKGITSVKNYK